MNYACVTLTKLAKGLYDKNFKYLMKEIAEDIRIWNYLPCSWIGGINIAKIVILLNTIYRFNTTLTKIPTQFL